MSSRSSSQRVFVIGGSEGIGLAAAARFAAKGCDVLIASRQAAKLSAALKTLESHRQSPQQILRSAVLDATDPSQVQDVLSSWIRDVGSPDIVLQAAGYAHPGYAEQLPLEAYRGMMEVNYFSGVSVVKALLPSLIAARRGHIVLVSSMGGYLGLFGYTGYCASKYAVIGFARALKQELAPYGIAVSVLCPPNTRTPGFEQENKIKPAEVLALEERAGMADPDAVADSLIRALPRRPFLIHPTWQSWGIYHASRWFPNLTDYVSRRKLHATR